MKKKKKKKLAFTVIELIATLTLLAIILAIAVPTVQNLIKPSTISAFKSDAKLVLRTALSKNEQNSNFDVTSINAGNLADQLSIRSENFKNVTIEKNNPNTSLETTAIRIEGQGRWKGYYACGTYNNMRVTQEVLKCTGDLFPPILTILGNNPENIFLGETYNDPGATAIDAVDGDITDKIVTKSSLNVNVPGTYTIIYTVTDSNDNVAVGQREVNVIDNVGPRITFTPNGNNISAKSYDTVINVIDDSSLDPDSYKYVWTTSTVIPTKDLFVNTYTDGQTISTPNNVTDNYYLWAVAKDKLGNESYISSNLFNLDNTSPVITILGSNPLTMYAGGTYIDAGATAIDTVDGDVTSKVIVTGTVNPSLVGTYTITYTVKDNANNQASATRTVYVTDSTPPSVVFGMNGNSAYATSRSTTVTLTDNESGVNVNSLKYQWTTSTTAPVEASFSTSFTNGASINTPSGATGGYYLWILAKDNANNTGITRSNVFNLDNIPPTISIIGGSSISINLGSPYTDAGATASDNLSGINGSVTASGSVNINAVGTYTITYSATDYAGLTTTATRTVTVNAITQYRYRDSYSYQSCSQCPNYAPYGCSTTAIDHYGGTPPDTWYWYTSYECGCGSYDSSYGQCIEWRPTGSYYDCNCTTQSGWNSWSSWSTTPATPSSSRQVETRSCTAYPCPTT